MCKTSAALNEPSLVFGVFCLWSMSMSTHTPTHQGRDAFPLPSWCVLELLRVCFYLLYLCEHACSSGGMRSYAQPCGCLSMSVCKSPATSQHYFSEISLHQCCHKIMWQGVNHEAAWGTWVTRGFLAERFCEQHQERGNSGDHSTEQIL